MATTPSMDGGAVDTDGGVMEDKCAKGPTRKRVYSMIVEQSGVKTYVVASEGDKIQAGGKEWVLGTNGGKVTLTRTEGDTTTTVDYGSDSMTTQKGMNAPDVCFGAATCAGFSVTVQGSVETKVGVTLKVALKVTGTDGKTTLAMVGEGDTVTSEDGSVKATVKTGSDGQAVVAVVASGFDKDFILAENGSANLGGNRSVTLVNADQSARQDCEVVKGTFRINGVHETQPLPEGTKFRAGANSDTTFQIVSMIHEDPANMAPEKQVVKLVVTTPNKKYERVLTAAQGSNTLTENTNLGQVTLVFTGTVLETIAKPVVDAGVVDM